MQIKYLIKSALIVFLWAFAPRLSAQTGVSATRCELCGKPFGQQYYLMTDKVTGVRRAVCAECLQRPDRCFACGLPIAKKETTLNDGRHYCERDAASALFAVADIQKVVLEAEARLRRLMVDEMAFPNRDLNVTVVDRVNIEALFGRPGNDHRCPNVMGYYETLTNRTRRTHEIYLLSGLSESRTRAVFAHEMTHAWMADHVPTNRKPGGDATEGFCELIAYLLLKDLHDEPGLRAIEANQYTRGQFEIFRRAEQTYNLRSVIEWVCYGTEPLIKANDIDEVRRAEKPAKAPARLWVNYSDGKSASESNAEGGGTAEDDSLRLKAIVGSEKHRTALINNRTFAAGETGRVKLGNNLLELRCEEIGTNFVRVESVASGKTRTLLLGDESHRVGN